jgi:flagellar FliL protein
MSEDKATEVETAGETGRGKRRTVLLVGLPLVLLLLGGGGAAAYVMGLLPFGGNAAAAAKEAAVPDPADIVFVDLPDLLINLNGGAGRRMRFLKLATAVEVAGEQQAETVRQFVPRILDSFHMYLRAVRPEELEGTQGVYRIKEELLARTNEAVRPAQVRSVLIRELLVQ